MSYISLYRKYRSQTFNDLVEQNSVVKILQNAVKHERLSHAYIFSGPRGTGKTSVARIFAKTINCLNLKQETAEPCNECSNCLSITKGDNLDVIEIDAASHTGVDNVRELIEKVNFLPSMGKYKVYIIDETHMLSTSAFNALLKTIEEPPGHVIFILATTDPHKIPATIHSRCQRLDFNKISQAGIVNHLQFILSEEKVDISDDAVKLIARYSGGHLRDALSICDQLISYSDGKIEADNVTDALGTANIKDIENLISSVKQDRLEDYFKLMEDLFYKGMDPVVLITDILDFLRQVLLVKLDMSQMILVTADMLESYTSIADLYEKQEVVYAVQSCSEALQRVKNMEDSRVLLQVMLLDYLKGVAIVQEVVKKVTVQSSSKPVPVKTQSNSVGKSQDNSNYDSSKPYKKTTAPTSQYKATVKEIEPIRPDVAIDLVSVKHHWPDVVAYLRRKKKKIQVAACLQESTPTRLEENVIVVAFQEQHQFHYNRLQKEENAILVDQSATEIFSRPIQVKYEVLNKTELPTNLSEDKFEEKSFIKDETIPDDIKDIASAFGAEAVEKI